MELASMIVCGVLSLLGLFIIPFGLPGLWIMVACTVGLTAITGKLGWGWVVLFVAMGGVAELLEFLSGQWGAKHFGGSSKAGWGAIIGGFAGLFLGVPIPVIGSLVGSFIGTFSGAVLGEMYEQRQRRSAGERSTDSVNIAVGFGAIIGRAFGIGTKLCVAFLIMGISVAVVGWGSIHG